MVTNNSCIVKGCIKFVSRRQGVCSGQDSGIQETFQSSKSKLPVPAGYDLPILGALRHFFYVNVLTTNRLRILNGSGREGFFLILDF